MSNKATQKDKDDDFTTIEKASATWNRHGYNVTRVHKKGDKIMRKGKKKSDISKGKEAEGSWEHWQKKKQTQEDLFGEVIPSGKDKGKISGGLFNPVSNPKPCNIGIIHGDISGDEVWGSCAIDGDGVCVDIIEEAILSVNNDELTNKLQETFQTISPNGKHYLLKYRKIDFQDLRGRTIFQGNTKHDQIKLIANGGYTVEAPSDGYTSIKGDLDKVAKLTKMEFNEFISCCEKIAYKSKEDSQPDWTRTATKAEEMSDEKFEKLVTIGEKFYKEGGKHDSTLFYGSVLRRNLRLNEQSVLKIFEALDPNDIKNHETIKDIFKRDLNKCASILTLSDHIAKMTNARTAKNIIRELKSWEPYYSKDRSRLSEGISEDEDEPKPAAILLELALKNIEQCFKDQDNNYYVMIFDKDNDSYKIIKLSIDDEFDQFLSLLYLEDTGGRELARKDWKALVVDNLKAKTAKKSGPL